MAKDTPQPKKARMTPEQRSLRSKQVIFVALSVILILTMVLSLVRF